MAIKINIGSLKDGSGKLDLTADTGEIGLDEKMFKNGLGISLDLFKAVHQLDVKAKITGIMTLVCDRCLDMYELPFETEFEIVFAQKSPRDEEVSEEGYRTYSPFMKTIDLTGDIREYVLLTVPMRRVPAETSEGTCTWCGKTKEYWQNLIKEEEK